MSNKDNDFYWSEEREPHFQRRKEILQKHPEVKELYGIDPGLKWKTIAMVIFQLVSAPYLVAQPWYIMLPFAYIFGASITHTIFLAIHEITHDLAFKRRVPNNWLALIANLPIVVPYAMSFRTYHMKHHWEQGNVTTDTDLPTEREARIFRGFLGKFLWAINQILFYAFRPMFVHPVKLEKWHKINIVFQLTLIGLYAYFFGLSAVGYLMLCLFLGGSVHPLAAHFISEHYVFKEGQETYSYYGPLNIFSLNVGYHNEHHDFPNIPGSRLPMLKKMAPEFYDSLFAHTSWTNVLYQFITNPKIRLTSRVKRNR